MACKNVRSWLTTISAPSNPFSASSSSSIDARSRWLVGSSNSNNRGGSAREHAGHARAQPFAAAERAGDLQGGLVAEREPRQRGMGFVVGQITVQSPHV